MYLSPLLPQPLSSPSDLPPVRWDLVVAAKQLLRQKHHRAVSLHPPRPTSTRYTDNTTLQNAGANALNESQIKAAEQKYIHATTHLHSVVITEALYVL